MPEGLTGEDRPATIAVTRYKAPDLPQDERYAEWLKRPFPSIAQLFDMTRLGPFDVQSETAVIDGMIFAHGQLPAMAYDRSAAKIAQVPCDYLAVNILIEGTAHGVMGDRPLQGGPGTVFLQDLSQPSYHESSAVQTLTLMLPRAMAEQSLSSVHRLHGRTASLEHASFIVSHALRLREELVRTDVRHGPRLIRSTMDLVAVAFDDDLSGARGGARINVAGRVAREEIESRLGSSRLTVTTLCKVLGVSRTTLHRMFEADGGVQSYVRARRLEQVRMVLLDPRSNEQISSLAERWGFSDAAHLSRLFKARYGMTPTEYRALPGNRNSG